MHRSTSVAIDFLPYENPRVFARYILQSNSLLEQFSMEVDFDEFEEGGDF